MRKKIVIRYDEQKLKHTEEEELFRVNTTGQAVNK